MSAVKLVLVDFDDTLVNTAPRFQTARRRLFGLLNMAGIEEALARRIHHDHVEPLMLERHGLGPSRLEHSFRATYEALCQASGTDVDPVLAAECAEIGRSVYGTPPLFDGALDALRQLSGRYATVLYTQAADREYQMSCVQESGIRTLLGEAAVHISPRKTAESFREVLSTLGIDDPAGVWMVGNSIRSDINPALEVGAQAILVEVEEPWEFDLVDPVSHDFVRVRNFPEAVSYLLRLGA
jgi:putative hydrolase of the HAD superfamily